MSWDFRPLPEFADKLFGYRAKIEASTSKAECGLELALLQSVGDTLKALREMENPRQIGGLGPANAKKGIWSYKLPAGYVLKCRINDARHDIELLDISL